LQRIANQFDTDERHPERDNDQHGDVEHQPSKRRPRAGCEVSRARLPASFKTSLRFYLSDVLPCTHSWLSIARMIILAG
jgi:hypothetical protein